MMMLRRIFIVASFLVAGAPALHGQQTIEALRAVWRAGNYQTAYDLLKEYRKQPYGKTFEVYYMSGTSLCRLGIDQARLGNRYLQWVLDNFSLSEDARSTVKNEQQANCPPAIDQPPIVVAWSSTAATAGVSGRTKMFYWADRENALASVPVEVVREIPRQEILARLWPPDAVNEAKAGVARQFERAIGDGAELEIGAGQRFVLASVAGQPRSELDEMAATLDRAYSFFIAEYGMRPPEWLITSYIVADPAQMQQLAESLHGIRVAPQSLGYSYQDDMSMVGYIPTSSVGTLLHELFHLMVRNDFGDIPPWLDEGLAALYEVSQFDGETLRGMPNWRGRVLDSLSNMQPSVEELVRMNWRDFSAAAEGDDTALQAVNHAKARYLMLYLQETGKLTQVYKRFQAREVGTDSSNLLKKTLTVDNLEDVELDFQQWFRTRGGF